MTGKEIYDLAVTRVGCKYRLGAIVAKNDPNYFKEFDCAELCSWTVFQLGKFLYGCDTYDVSKAAKADAYTGYWYRDAKLKGIMIPVKQAIGTKGAILLRVGVDGTTGHILISDGKGGTVEAYSTKYGVIMSVTDNRRFDYGILLPGFTYDEARTDYVSEKPKGIVYRYTQPMMPKSDVVKRIQAALILAGYPIKGGPDGLFGRATENAVYDFQKNKGLTPDGEVYTATAAELKVKL